MKTLTGLKQSLASLSTVDALLLNGFAILLVILAFIAAELGLILKLLCARL